MALGSKPYRILYVDDNPADRRLMQEALNSTKPNVHLEMVGTGEELLARIETVPLPNLILMDWNLPGISGFELLKKLKSDQLSKRIPLVVFTTSLSGENIIEIYNERANCIVEKPLGFEAFVSLIDRIEEFWVRTSLLPEGMTYFEAAPGM